jgi:hypothetical protein
MESTPVESIEYDAGGELQGCIEDMESNFNDDMDTASLADQTIDPCRPLEKEDEVEYSSPMKVDTLSPTKREDALDTSEEVTGPDGQVCSNQAVLDQILKRYTHINSNVFRGGANGKIPNEFMRCDCKYTPGISRAKSGEDDLVMACGHNSGCINRELSIECGADCPTGEYCQNKKFQQKAYACIQIFKTRKKGFGLRTKHLIRKGEFVIEYCGEVLGAGLFQKRIEEYSKKGARHFYFMSLKANEQIDASKKGNVSRFINHSCNPNCVLEKWVVGNQMRVGIFAKTDIEEGDELTFDYKFERYGSKAQVCYCGEENCSGYIGKDKNGAILNLDELDGLSEEDDEESEANQLQQKVVTGRPLSTIEHVREIVKYLMLHSSTPNKVLKALNRILKTDSTWLLRKFVHYRGIYLLYRCLDQHINGKEILRYNILLVLKSLPVSTKNPVQEIEKLVEDLDNVNEYGDKTSELAKQVLESWKDLVIEYRIPKRLANDVDNTPKTELPDIKRPRVEKEDTIEPTTYITHKMEDLPIEKPILAWNSIVSKLTPVLERTDSMVSTSSNPTVDTLSETSIQQMVRAAQEATKQASEAARKKQQDEEERKKKIMEIKKRKIKEQKLKLKELQLQKSKSEEKSSSKDRHRDKKDVRKESSKDRSKDRQEQDKPKEKEKIDSLLSVEQRANLKAEVLRFDEAFQGRYIRSIQI